MDFLRELHFLGATVASGCWFSIEKTRSANALMIPVQKVQRPTSHQDSREDWTSEGQRKC